MPSRDRLNDFIAMVESGDHVRAIEDFYHEDASMQENGAEPRKSRDVLVNFEASALDSLASMITHPVNSVVLDEDKVAIHWTFEQTLPDGRSRIIDEIAMQQWEGDRIMKERFFYDSAASKWR